MTDPGEIRAWIDSNLMKAISVKPGKWEGDAIPWLRASAWISKNTEGDRWREILSSFIIRRDATRYQDAYGKPFRYFFEDAIKNSPCCCQPVGGFFRSVISGLATMWILVTIPPKV